jgi:hypothetical protein
VAVRAQRAAAATIAAVQAARAVRAFTRVPVATLLREAGAEWPAVLQYDGLH